MPLNKMAKESGANYFTVNPSFAGRLSARNLRADGSDDCSVLYDLGATLGNFSLILRNALTILDGFCDMFFEFV